MEKTVLSMKGTMEEITANLQAIKGFFGGVVTLAEIEQARRQARLQAAERKQFEEIGGK